jgi:heme/copper-type cytochrome/quinol oxidase subunit 2
MKRKIAILVLFFLILFPEMVEAQCAMCRAALESEADNSQAEGINNGIVYLMAIPYILVAGLFFFIYRKLKNRSTAV